MGDAIAVASICCISCCHFSAGDADRYAAAQFCSYALFNCNFSDCFLNVVTHHIIATVDNCLITFLSVSPIGISSIHFHRGLVIISAMNIVSQHGCARRTTRASRAGKEESERDDDELKSRGRRNDDDEKTSCRNRRQARIATSGRRFVTSRQRRRQRRQERDVRTAMRDVKTTAGTNVRTSAGA